MQISTELLLTKFSGRDGAAVCNPQTLKRTVASTLVLGTLLFGGSAFAEEEPVTEENLPALEADLKSAKDALSQSEAQAEQLAKDAKALRDTLVKISVRIEVQENRIAALEYELDELEQNEAQAVTRLTEQRASLSTLLGAMQTLERRRPPAMLVAPTEAVAAVRGAILLDDVYPALLTRARTLAQGLTDLRVLRDRIHGKEDNLQNAKADLEKELAALDQAIKDKDAQRNALALIANSEQQRVAKLSQEVTSLRSLIDNLDQMAANLDNAAAGPSFRQAKGTLRWPVAGEVVKILENDPVGDSFAGITFETREKAQVIAPFDGRIVFAGPFMHHDQLLLIEAGEGYHILLSGLAHIFGEVGDRLLAGEPIGLMGQSSELGERERGKDKSRLYLEFRKNGSPVDPMPWLVRDSRKVSG